MRIPTAALVVAALVSTAVAETEPAKPTVSFELPAGYTELPGATDEQMRQLRSIPGTRSADAHLYVSPDEAVQLTRITWQMKQAGRLSRKSIERFDQDLVAGAAEKASHVSDSRSWSGDQLVAETVDEKDGIRVKQVKMLSGDTDDVLHIVFLTCAGATDQLGDCEKAQQTLKVTLPNQATLAVSTSDDNEKSQAYRLGYLLGYYGVPLLVIGLIVLAIRKWG